MKQAVIDIGTNSTLLLIGEMDSQQQVNSIFQKFKVTRLGSGVHRDGVIRSDAMQRTINILDEYRFDILKYNTEQVHVIGTQALRLAKNADDFKNLLFEKYGWQLKIISGDEEARCSFIGATDSIPLSGEAVLVMDVGGGSTELILGRKDKILNHNSLPLGVVKFWEEFQKKDTLSITEKNTVIDKAKTEFEKLKFNDHFRSSSFFIGVGGTITTLAAIKEKMVSYQPDKIDGYKLTLSQLKEMFDFLNELSAKERLKLPLLVPGREDVILYGTLIFIALMKFASIDQVIASSKGLRFGYLKQQYINA